MKAADAPIFIGGLSHSGKTPLRIILGAHPELSLTRKTRLWERYYGRFGDLDDPRALDRCLRAISADRSLASLAPDVDTASRALAGGPVTYARLFGVLHADAAARLGARRWGEQLGFVERYADPIFAEFPDARMIHLVRDPVDRTATVLGASRPRSGRRGWETAKWRRSTELAARNEERHGARYRVVPYEALVEDPETTVRSLCDFVDEEYVPEIACCARAFARTTARTPSSRGSEPPRHPVGALDRFATTAWQLLERRRTARIRR